MALTRRLLRLLKLLTLVLVALVVASLVVTQTPWFRDWLRRTAMRQAERVIDGQLIIGRIEGTLFTGVVLRDVSVVQEGAPVVSIDRVEVRYGLGELLSDGRVIGRLHVERPVVRAIRTPTGWNLGRLLRPRAPSRPGAPRPTFALPDITVEDARVTIEGAGAEPARTLPRRIDGLSFRGGVTSGGETLAIDIRALRLEAAEPDLSLADVHGRLVNDTAGWHFENLHVQTGDSVVDVTGDLTRTEEGGPLTFALDVAGSPVSLPEVGRFLPAVAAIDVRPRFTARVEGPLDALRVDLHMSSEAGDVRGPVTLDLRGPTRSVAADVDIADIDLAPWLDDTFAEGAITGHARVNLRFPSATPGVALDGAAHFEGPSAGAYGYAARDVVADARFVGRRIELVARASAYGGRATTRGFIQRAARPGERLVLSLAGDVSDIDLRQLPPELAVPPLETAITGAYTVEGPVGRLHLAATLDASVVEGAHLGDGFTGAFQQAPDGYAFTADGSVADLDLPRLGRALELPALADERWAGRINGTFRVQGTKDGDAPLLLTAAGELQDTRVYGGHVPQMAVDARLSGDVLDVVARGAVQGYDLAAVSGIEALTGNLTGDVDARVTFQDLRDVAFASVDVDGTVTLRTPTLLDVPFTQVDADVALTGGVLDVRRLRGTGDGFTLTGKGTLALGEAGASDFAYELDAASVVGPARIADLPLTGAVTTSGRITGPRQAFHVEGTLEGADVAYEDVVRAVTVQGRYAIDLPDLEPDRLRVSSEVAVTKVDVAGVGLESARGTVGYTPDLLAFDVVATDGPRTLRGDGTLALADGAQVLTLNRLAIEREGVRWALAGETAPAALTIRPDAVDIVPLTLVSGTQRLKVGGRIALADEATHALDLEASAVDLGAALVLAARDIDADGLVSLSAHVGGSGRLPTVSGTLDVTGARYRDVPIARLHATVENDGGAARLDAILQQSDSAYVTARGRVPRTLFLPPDTPDVPTSLDDTLDLTIRSSAIDLALAGGLTDQVADLAGTAQLDLRMTNTGRTPVVAGEVTLQRAGFLVAATGVRYEPIDAVLAFDDDRAFIRRLTAGAPGGAMLTAEGEVGLRGDAKGRLDLRFKGDGVRALDNELGRVALDAALAVSGTICAPVVEGDLRIASGRVELDALLPRLAIGSYATEATYRGIPTYTSPDAPPIVPDILAPDVRDAEVIYAVPPAPATDARAAANGDTPGDADAQPRQTFVYEDMAMNIRVRIPDNLLLRGQNVEVGRSGIGDINVTMGGDFRIAKTAGEPLVLIGAVNTVRGTYAYQGRRFDIARDGQVLFRGDSTSNPELDITAERVIQGVEARVRIQGTVRDPRISLSSEPPLDEADVLALIVFNQPVNQLGIGQQNSLAERAGGIAAGLAVSPIAQALGNTLNLDLFDVETTDTTGRVNPAVVIGEQVNERVFVKFRQQFGNQEVSQFLLEYRLADYLRLQANAAEGDGLTRANRSLTQRVERYGADLVFYFAF